MNILNEVIREHSKRNTIRVSEIIAGNKRLLSQIIDFVMDKDMEISRKSAWVMRCCYENNPESLDPYLSLLIRHLKKNAIHDAVKRNILGILKTAVLPDKEKGNLVNICFRFLGSASEPVSVKAFSMDILFRIGTNEPSILNELRIIIEDQIPYGSGGFKSKGQRIITEIIRKHSNDVQ